MKEFFIKANEGTAYRCQARNVSQGQRRRFTDRCQSCSIWHFWLLGDQGLSAESILKLSREKAITDVAETAWQKMLGFQPREGHGDQEYVQEFMNSVERHLRLWQKQQYSL